jgi:transposase
MPSCRAHRTAPSLRSLFHRIQELEMHLAWRWFTGLSFDQEIPHHSTFSMNPHGRFLESNLFQHFLKRSWIAARKRD